MYKLLKIGGEEYKFEFSIEASLYNNCIEKITTLMLNVDNGQTNNDIKSLLTSVSDIPQTAIECFYAGLLEHHGMDGDKRVPNVRTAKLLIREMFQDDESECHNWNDVLELCTTQMREDGFFALIGLSTESKRQPKVPQDHKRKQTKIKEVSEN